MKNIKSTLSIATLAGVLAIPSSLFSFQGDGEISGAQLLPNTGQVITPTLPSKSRFEYLNPGLTDFPQYTAGQAVSTVASPDHKTLLILTSGYNDLNATSGANAGKQINADSNEYIFIYDISTKIPLKKQVIQVPNTYAGITFDPSGQSFYVAGGDNDNVHIYSLTGTIWAETAGSPVSLGHKAANGLAVSPEAAGIAITADGTKIVVANYYNDSISILTKGSTGWTKSYELDLRPGKLDPAHSSGFPGGEYPFWVSIAGNNVAYISSIRDREIDVVTLAGTPMLTARIKVVGQPNKMTLNTAGTLLYVAEDETDTVDVIDTIMNKVTHTIAVGAPTGLIPNGHSKYTGHNTNSVSLSPDQGTLYATNGNSNDVAVVNLKTSPAELIGLIPTGWYPTSLSTNVDGSYLYVVNAKSPTGPNPGNCHGLTTDESTACAATNQYDLQLIKAGLQSLPTPTVAQLSKLTEQVAKNNNFERRLSASDKEKIDFLQSKIKHVIYIIKENRTYDQILGDAVQGNGDPDLTEFGATTTPNLHSAASQFVTLDNFFDRSEVSMDGWPWSTSARAPDVVEKQTWVNYGGRGVSYDSEGTNRNINVAYPTLAQRDAANPLTGTDPDLLPGTTDTAAPDGPDNEINTGYLWNGALRAGLTIRNYGFFIDLTRYNLPAPYTALSIPELTDPFATKTQVSYAANVALMPFTDPYFRGFDNVMPDYYRFQEWSRDFDENFAKGGLPSLSLVRFMHDHTGNFGTALNGVNTPELQVADNDYAVGLLLEKISNSRYKDDTLVFVIEDDAQDGADHVDAHRSIAFIVGPYVKKHKVVSSAYNTVDFVRTIEVILGIKPLNLNDAIAVPMLDVFSPDQKLWSFTSRPSPMLANTTLPIPSSLFAGTHIPKTTHSAAYWAAATKGMDFSSEDKIDFDTYNHILWKGLMGKKPYPSALASEETR